MSKRNKKRGKAKAGASAPSQGFGTDSPTGVTGKMLPSSMGRDSWRTRRWLIFGAVALLLIGVWGVFAARQNHVWPFHEREEVIKGKLIDPKILEEAAKEAEKLRTQQKRNLEEWTPVNDDDKLIGRFVTSLRDRKAEAYAMLATPPDFPTTLEEVAHRKADLVLRDKNLRVLGVFRGEPGPTGEPRPVPRRYTLVMKGVESGGLLDPEVVVEVQGKGEPRIHPIRAVPGKRP